MNSQPVQRHDIIFSMSESSRTRVDGLLARCGHTNLNLLLARGLALVEWVQDQIDLGRTVGSVIYGEQELAELRERAELLKPCNAIRIKPETPAEAHSPVKATNPKLVARCRIAPEHKTTETRPRARRLFKHAAFAVNDETGPVRSLAFHQHQSDAMGLEPPVSFNGQAMPSDLGPFHLNELQHVIDTQSMATHFRMRPGEEQLVFYGYFPKTGWHYLDLQLGQWVLDDQVQAGNVSLYSMDIAALYLRRMKPTVTPPESVALQA